MTSQKLFSDMTRYDLKHDFALQKVFPGLTGEVMFLPPLAAGERAYCDIAEGETPRVALPKRAPDNVRMHEMAHAAIYYLVPWSEFDAAPDNWHEVAAMFIEAITCPSDPMRYIACLQNADLLAWAKAMAANGRGDTPTAVVLRIMRGGFHESS